MMPTETLPESSAAARGVRQLCAAPETEVLVLDTADFSRPIEIRGALSLTGRSSAQPLLLLLERADLPELHGFLADRLLADFLIKPFDETTLRTRTGKLLAMSRELESNHTRLADAELRIECLRTAGTTPDCTDPRPAPGGAQGLVPDEGTAQRLRVENRLVQALRSDAFELYYQPKIAPGGRQTVGFEALLRWTDPYLGQVPPATFVPIAEESGLITEISAWVLRAACEQLQRWRQAGVSVVPVAVNLSARDLANPGLPEMVHSTLAKSGVEPELLELEVTEGALINDLEAAIKRLTQLQEIGVSIALDDFGTGYSSLSYLHRIPIDTLKIDRSFIRNITEDWNSAAITSSVITLSHVLNLNVVAEGVETAEQLELLMDQRCDQIQGALFSMPMNARAAGRWLGNDVG